MDGSNPKEAARIDVWHDQCDEIQQGFWNSEYVKSDNPTEEMKDTLMLYLMPVLKVLSTEMAKNETIYIGGNKISMADVALFSLLDSLSNTFPILLPSFPLLSAFHETFQTLPKIHHFCESGSRW